MVCWGLSIASVNGSLVIWQHYISRCIFSKGPILMLYLDLWNLEWDHLWRFCIQIISLLMIWYFYSQWNGKPPFSLTQLAFIQKYFFIIFHSRRLLQMKSIQINRAAVTLVLGKSVLFSKCIWHLDWWYVPFLSCMSEMRVYFCPMLRPQGAGS